jgi:hypothetical protein
MGLFKTIINRVTNSSALNAFIDSQNGSDLIGDGSRNNPYATITKAFSSGIGKTYVIRGVFNENANAGDVTNTYILGDDEFSKINGNITMGSAQGSFSMGSYGIKITGTINNPNINAFFQNSYFTSYNTEGSNLTKNNFIETFIKGGGNIGVFSGFINNTIKNCFNYINNSYCIISNSIIISELNLYNFTSRSNTTYYPIFQNCLFRKATLWKWNTATITINWTNNPVGGAAYDTDVTLMTRVYNSLLFYANSLGAGTDKTYFLAILATQDTMFKECVVRDDSDTVNNPIFSRYVDGVPVDYTLALKSNNPALYMSTTGSYVGCYAANVNDDGHGNHITFGAVKHVDETTGLDTTTSPDLLIQDPSNPAKFSASQTSLQLWNRIRTSVVEYPRGKSFAGMQSQLDSGIASRLFFGKRQEIRTTGDINQKTTAFESVEVIPYDSLPTPNTGAENDITGLSATLPRFSAPFNGECLLFYKGGNLLKFNDYNGLKTLFTGQGTVAITSGSAVVTGTSTAFTADFVKDDNIRIAGVDYKVLSVASNTSLTLTTNSAVTLSAQTYQVGVTVDKSYAIYGNWVVSNADIESYSLLLKTAKAGLTTSIPLIKWCKFELNLHYDEQ